MLPVIMAAASAATGIAGSLIKSRNARRANEQNQALLDAQRQKNENYYNRYYNADATQLADNRALLTEAQDKLMRYSRAAAGTSAVTGASNASSAATKQANNEAYAQAVRGVSANAQQYKQHIQDQYRSTDATLANRQMAITQQRNTDNADAIDAAVNGVNTVASAYISKNQSNNNGNGKDEKGTIN